MPPKGWKKYPIIEGKSRCPGCEIYKLIEDFHKGSSYCGSCNNERSKIWRERPESLEVRRRIEARRQADPIRMERRRIQRKIRDAKPENKKKLKDGYLKRHHSSPRYALTAILGNKRYRKELPLIDPINIDILMNKWERQQGLCALSGVQMTWAPGHYGPDATSLSVDKINPELGYTETNTRLICHCVNSFRGRMNDEQLLEFATLLVNNLNKNKNSLIIK